MKFKAGGRRVNLNMRAPRSSGTGFAVKRCAPAPQPSAGSDTHTRAKPSSANQSQIRGTWSGSCRPRVQITVPPCAHSWVQKPIVRRMSSSVMSPNIPHTSTR
jgi:hypothetical protein